MKIDGMDASGVSNSMAPEVATPTKENISNANTGKANTNDSKKNELALDTVNLSQMTTQDKKELPVSEKVIIDAIEKANKAISGGNRRFEFSIHSKTKEIMVKVIDSDTGNVIREIPSEKTLDMVAKFWEMAGIALDERR